MAAAGLGPGADPTPQPPVGMRHPPDSGVRAPGRGAASPRRSRVARSGQLRTPSPGRAPSPLLSVPAPGPVPAAAEGRGGTSSSLRSSQGHGGSASRSRPGHGRGLGGVPAAPNLREPSGERRLLRGEAAVPAPGLRGRAG